MTVERQTLTAVEVATILGISKAMVFNLWWAKDMPCLLIGDRRVMTRQQLAEYMEKAAARAAAE